MILHYYTIIITENNNRIEVDGLIKHSCHREYKPNSCNYQDVFYVEDYEIIKKEILKKELDFSDICNNQVIIKSLSVIKD